MGELEAAHALPARLTKRQRGQGFSFHRSRVGDGEQEIECIAATYALYSLAVNHHLLLPWLL